mmetsp:Transcript_17170/g.35527  ORF Transcript_17170/g.35527 Transcript_17170/m.35527 type:complete len:302 (-) Transcript_17170:75-980(-)|eukprot:CAMPEP_0168174320 /NCGR_PEP_ID=MMETSP0139_2-20121125/6430_1 /TAXON_ID=44445 /ORGANISM="Pseudo-nitzschia australis, Strain 10249 10 AB" /LENGTH=301 /DNA_ID=CAMNT_0008092441 /DNA_START=322 /DNA_END=1227 /DNA_ORIENTATION=-
MKKAIRPLAAAVLLPLTIYYDGSSNKNNENVALGFALALALAPAPTPPNPTRASNTNHCKRKPSFVSRLNYAAEGNRDDLFRRSDIELAELANRFTSPVLKQHCAELLDWIERYGHPNIPLKNDGGNACQVLRRLHVQKKLTETEVDWLESIGFRFHSIEDVYRFADFDEMLTRLLDYERDRPNNNFQVPKKCPEDPELGAWVTGMRRLGMEGVKPEHERRLNEIGFAWKSTRKCGSKFMTKFREYTKRVEEQDDGLQTVMRDPETILWIRAQQLALKKGALSQTRVEYMGQLFGDTWTTR